MQAHDEKVCRLDVRTHGDICSASEDQNGEPAREEKEQEHEFERREEPIIEGPLSLPEATIVIEDDALNARFDIGAHRGVRGDHLSADREARARKIVLFGLPMRHEHNSPERFPLNHVG